MHKNNLNLSLLNTKNNYFIYFKKIIIYILK